MKNRIEFIGSMLIFGSIGVFVRNIALPSIDIAFLRAVIGSVFLLFAGYVMKQKISLKAIRKNSWLLILSGSAIGFNWILLFQAYKYTTISNATLSYYFAPVFVVLLAPIFLKERLTIIKTICVVAAMGGLFLIVGFGSGDMGGSYNHFKGVMYGLSAAVLYASVIMMNKFIKDLSGYETTLVQLSIAALVLLPDIVYQHNLVHNKIGISACGFILILGIVHTGIAYLIYFSCLKKLEGQSIAILSYIDPISAVMMAAVFLGESITMVKLIGGVLILGSTFLSERMTDRIIPIGNSSQQN